MKTYRVGIVGSRSFNDKELMYNYLNSKKQYISMVVSGNAEGADKMGQQWALENELDTLIIPPKWKEHGKGAAFRRNKQIVENSDYIIAFHDGVSKGTLNTLEWAKKLDKKIKIIKFTPITNDK